jgi:outer membrane protein TolC
MKTTIRIFAGVVWMLTLSSTAFAQDITDPEAPNPDGPAPVEDAPQSSAMNEELDDELGVAGGLTADDVAGRATATSYKVAAKRAQVLAAAASVDEALLGYAPRLTLTARYSRVSDSGGGSLGSLVAAPNAPEGPIAPDTQLVNVPLSFPQQLNNYTFMASLNVPLSDYVLRIPNAHAAAKHGVRAAELSESAAKRGAAADARLAYYGFVRARLSAVVARHTVAAAKAHVTDAEHANEIGTATPADLLAAKSQLAQAELLDKQTRQLVKTQQAHLRTLMHKRGKRPFAIGEDVRGALPVIDMPEDDEQLWEEAISRRVEIKAIKAQESAIREQISLTRAGYYPRLDGFGTATYANPNKAIFPQEDAFRGSWEVGLQLSMTINDIPGAVVDVRQLEAQLAEARAERESLSDSIKDEITGARGDLDEAEVAVRVGKRRLAAAEEAYRVRHILFREGQATMTELIDADTNLTQARLDLLNALVDIRVSRVRLLYALGRNTGG